MKLAQALISQAAKALTAKSVLSSGARVGANIGGLPGLLHSISPEMHVPGSAVQYSLKLPSSAGTLMKVVHFGVQPALLAKGVADTVENVKGLSTVKPENLRAVGISSEDAEKIYSRAKARVYGRAAGDAASWALYPLAIANPMLHYPAVLGGSIAAPHIGEAAGLALSGK